MKSSLTTSLLIVSLITTCHSVAVCSPSPSHDNAHPPIVEASEASASSNNAWDAIQKAITKMDDGLKSNDLSAIHNAEETLARSLAAIQNSAALIDSDEANRLQHALNQALTIGTTLHAAADTGDKTKTASELKKLKAALQLVEAQYPPELLAKITIPQEPTIIAKVTVEQPLKVGNKTTAVLQLTQADGTPIQIKDLVEAHTQKIHLLIIDASLTDYHHEHPIPTNTPGQYLFSFTPNKPGPYRIWTDIIPVATQRQEYVITDIPAPTSSEPIANREVNLTNTINGLTYTLTFDTPKLIAGEHSLGTLTISDSTGKPINTLEPVMGAYAHIVGFSEDYKSIAHIHPMGPEPTTPSDRGQGILTFHLAPETSGLLRLFAQVQINGKNIFVPFTLQIDKDENTR